MNTRFLFQGTPGDDPTKGYILKRLERIAKLLDPVTQYEIEVDRDKKGKYRVEIMAKTPHNLYRAEETSESAEGSADIVIDELEIQIDKRKNRNRDLRLRGERSIKKSTVLDDAARLSH